MRKIAQDGSGCRRAPVSRSRCSGNDLCGYPLRPPQAQQSANPAKSKGRYRLLPPWLPGLNEVDLLLHRRKISRTHKNFFYVVLPVHLFD